MAKTKKEQVTEQATKTTLEQVFAMWKQTAKSGKSYFTGKYKGDELRGFYNSNKKNPNEPDVKIYTVKDGELSKEPILVLWCNATDSGKKYLSGKIADSRVVGFINEKANAENKQPYFSVYYSEDKPNEEKPEEKPEEKTEGKTKTKEKPQMEEIKDEDLPF